MARFGVGDADKYGGQGGGGYFRLADDHDVAQVRFLYDSIDDVEGFAVHEIEVDGKKRYANCLREYGQPVDVCPFCAAKRATQVKYFVPVFNIKEDRVQTWERGKKYGQKLSSLCARYPHLVSHTFDIERNGKAGDTNTTYEIYETGQDDTTLDSFEIPSPLGTIVLDMTADEMARYLADENGTGGGNGYGYGQPVRRGGDVRRTPSTTARREVF